VANKTYTKKNQEKLRVYLEKIKKDDHPKPINKDNRGLGKCPPTNQDNLLRQRF
jgi:hypothetical protein